ncbi:MAG: NADH:flavin oxidoreductase/NADH oxidase [Chloroflexi bacterium]|nr:NADH:flavin oxidoreductase/NADH oxidase [Chloroflexota bacterium]
MSKLFTPIDIRGETIRNRVFVSPMCQYSAEEKDGHPVSWHMVHLGSRAVGGAGLVMFEATSVTPEGRITPWDLGIWSDSHIDSYRPISEFITSHGATPAMQLAHAGRKASHDRPWSSSRPLGDDEGGWQVVGPSPLPFNTNEPTPRELTIEEIHQIRDAFGSAAERAVKAGIKVIELHLAHGYLGFEFLSPLSNQRTDMYGGSFDNRTRFPLEIVDAVRSSIPDSMPLFVRISSTEYMDEGWGIEDSVLFATQLKEHGVDLIDCSSGGNSPAQQVKPFPGYQVPFAAQIRSGANVLTGAVGLITDPHQSEEILLEEQADVILMGRELLRNPYWPLSAQQTLESEPTWANQYLRAAPPKPA